MADTSRMENGGGPVDRYGPVLAFLAITPEHREREQRPVVPMRRNRLPGGVNDPEAPSAAEGPDRDLEAVESVGLPGPRHLRNVQYQRGDRRYVCSSWQ